MGVEKIQMSSMYGRKRYRWNPRKFARNMGLLLLGAVTSFLIAYGILWGFMREYEARVMSTQNYLEQFEK